jgi:hypothetical protein
MTNINHTTAISDEELMGLAYDDDTLSASQHEHLKECMQCQQRLAMYRQTLGLLHARLYRSICPSAVQLNYYCLGAMPEQERIRIASHILDCPACADEVAEIRRAQAQVNLYPELPASPLKAIRRIFATLVVQQAKPVTRDMTPGTGWPRQYRAETIDLSLHLTRAHSGEMLLLGIITSTNPDEPVDAFEGARVELYNAPGPLAEDNTDSPLLASEVDDVGNIVLEGITAGKYVLLLHLPEREILVDGLRIDLK